MVVSSCCVVERYYPKFLATVAPAPAWRRAANILQSALDAIVIIDSGGRIV